MNELVIKNKQDLLKQTQGDGLLKAESFIRDFLSIEPESNEIKINDKANNARFIPISMIEDKLDEIFFGLWEVKDFRYQCIANEIAGSLQLRVFHPVAQTWIERTGAAAVMVQMKSKDKGGDGRISNIDNKILNTLEKDFPHLKAECVKNAARSLGKWFGRDLNRKPEMQGHYSPVYTNEVELQAKTTDLKQKLSTCSNNDELGLLWESLEVEEQNNLHIKKLFTARKMEIKNGL